MNFLRNIINWLPLLLMIIAATVFTLIIHHLGFCWTVSIFDGISSSVLLVFASFTGIHIINSYPTKAGLVLYALVIGIVAGKLAWALDNVFLKWWFWEQRRYVAWLQEVKYARILIAMTLSSWMVTHAAIQKKITVLEERFRNMTDAATLHREAELFKLRQQLQPHFLYNSLNSISALIMIFPEKAQEMIGRLSDFLRSSVKREGKEKIALKEELEYIEAYLSIEAVRFGDRLEVIYDRQYTDDATIPPFVLQPLLENAIKFGLYGNTGAVKISVQIKIEEGNLIIRIDNPFDPDNRPRSGTGFGLEGIQRRLFLVYGRTDLLETRQQNQQFTTILKIPQ